jgi:hypothetical protein
VCGFRAKGAGEGLRRSTSEAADSGADADADAEPLEFVELVVMSEALRLSDDADEKDEEEEDRGEGSGGLAWKFTKKEESDPSAVREGKGRSKWFRGWCGECGWCARGSRRVCSKEGPTHTCDMDAGQRDLPPTTQQGKKRVNFEPDPLHESQPLPTFPPLPDRKSKKRGVVLGTVYGSMFTFDVSISALPCSVWTPEDDAKAVHRFQIRWNR